MLTLARAFAIGAAALHVYIWVLESFRWTDARTCTIFGLSEEQAAVTKPLAYNQGFYNLFLAVVAGIGAAIVGARHDAGVALLGAATGSMLAAALVLVTADHSKVRSATIQGLLPLLSLLSLLAS